MREGERKREKGRKILSEGEGERMDGKEREIERDTKGERKNKSVRELREGEKHYDVYSQSLHELGGD